MAATDKDIHAAKPLHRLPFVWQSIERWDLPDVYTHCLFGVRELPHLIHEVHARAQSFLAECSARGIRCVLALGGPALRAISPITGRAGKLVGATITSGPVPFIIPVDTHITGIRAFRAKAWTDAMIRFSRRGQALAQGQGRIFEFPRIVQGEGNDVIDALQQILDERQSVGNDIETTGKDWRSDKITAMGLANRNVAVSVPWDAYTSRLYGPQPGLRNPKIRALVLEILRHPKIRKLFHNGMFDLSVLGLNGIRVKGPIDDTILAHKICHPDLYHNLQFCMSYEFAIHPWKSDFDLQRKIRAEGKEWSDTAPIPLMKYNAQDAAAECPLWERLELHLSRTKNGMDNYEKLKRLANLAADMQYRGVRIDLAERNKTAAESEKKIASIANRWATMTDKAPIAGKGSDAAIRNLFFKKMKAPALAISKKTGKETLNSVVLLEYAGMRESNERLAEIAWTLFEYRKIRKSYDAFIVPLTAARVHAKPNVTGTRGSRMSYSDPNLQQWSKDKTIVSPYSKVETKLAPSLRHLVCPDEGMVLGECDYNALELRIVAYAANLQMWLDWLGAGVDMHTEHVRLMFDRKVKKDDPLRQITKTLTFARLYNKKKTVDMVLGALKPSMPTLTAAFLTEIFERFDKAVPQIESWQESVFQSVTACGYVELPITGMRQIHDKQRPDINAALSFGIQSTGGDIINAAALRIRDRLDIDNGERILINVHDALIWQAPPERVEQVTEIFKQEMEMAVSIWGHTAIFPVETKVGPNWRDMRGVK